jgi:hypothetical protein
VALLDRCHARGLTAATINLTLGALRGVARHAVRLGLLDAAALAGLRAVRPRRNDALPVGRSATGGELAALLAVAYATSPWLKIVSTIRRTRARSCSAAIAIGSPFRCPVPTAASAAARAGRVACRVRLGASVRARPPPVMKFGHPRQGDAPAAAQRPGWYPCPWWREHGRPSAHHRSEVVPA